MEYLCKLIGTTQASCVFFSAFSIVLIAVDRFLFIVHPTSTQISTPQVNILEEFKFKLDKRGFGVYLILGILDQVDWFKE